jgi:hypothetical protein
MQIRVPLCHRLGAGAHADHASLKCSARELEKLERIGETDVAMLSLADRGVIKPLGLRGLRSVLRVGGMNARTAN